MREFFARTPDGDDSPVDVAQVRADDALIEALRQTPLFDAPVDSPARWSRSLDVDVRPGATESSALPGFGTSADFADFLGPAADDADRRDTAEVASDAQVAALLRAWRDEIDAVPLPPPLDTQLAVSLIRSAPQRRRSVRPMIAVAAAIAGLLMGSTAIGARSATPEDTLLWPVTQLLWGDRVEEVNASKEARDGIDEAAKAIDAGHPDAAEAALEHVTVVITRVEDSREQATLRSDLNRVQSQIESSRATPSATSPVSTTPPAPSIPTSIPADPPTTAPAPSVPVVPPVTDTATTTSEVPPPPPVEEPTTGEPVPSETTTPPGETPGETPSETPPTSSTEETSSPEVIPTTGPFRPDQQQGGATATATATTTDG